MIRSYNFSSYNYSSLLSFFILNLSCNNSFIVIICVFSCNMNNKNTDCLAQNEHVINILP
jgi:hypothetical protein